MEEKSLTPVNLNVFMYVSYFYLGSQIMDIALKFKLVEKLIQTEDNVILYDFVKLLLPHSPLQNPIYKIIRLISV